MRIYTKTGDNGETSLFRGGRVGKEDVRVEAYGQVDELNATLGLARAARLPSALDEAIARVQSELFDLGADLATPLAQDGIATTRLTTEATIRLEKEIDRWQETLPPLRQFILPGGAMSSAALHVSRTVCRRAERAVVRLSRQQEISPNVLPYLNRLSDWLFVAARLANKAAGIADTAWQSPRNR